MKKKLRRTLAIALSVFLVAGVVLPVEANAQYAEAIPADALSYGYGGQLDLRLVEGLLTDHGLSISELNGTDQSWINGISDNPQDPTLQELDLEALELISLNLGTLDLPLVGPGGLLEFVLSDTELGAIHEYANANTPNEAYGAVGLVGSDGSTVDLTQGGEGDTHARINLLSLLNLQQSNLFTSELISTASLELGVLGAKAERHDIGDAAEALCKGMNQVDYSTLHHPDLIDQYFVMSPELEISGEDDKKFCTDYRIADAKIILDAPLIEDLMSVIETQVTGLDSLINETLGEGGVPDEILSTITDLLNGVLGLTALLGLSNGDITLEIEAEVPVDIYNALLGETLSDEFGLVSINLAAGAIEIDLQQLHGGDLSDLDPNTPLLTSAQINQIAGTVTSLLTDSSAENPSGLMAHLENTLTGTVNPVTGVKSASLYDTAIEITVSFPTILLVVNAGSLHLKATLGDLLAGSGIDYTKTGVLNLLLPFILEGLVEDVAKAVGSLLDTLLFNGPDSIVSSLIGRVASADLVSTLVDDLSPLLNLVLQPVANAIVNRQTVEKIDQGNLFTVSALELNVLTLSGNPVTQQEEDRLIGLPIGTASVMAQHWDLIDLNLDVAKIGNGRDLHTGGYTYDLVCEADRWPGLAETGLAYGEDEVGDGFLFDPTTGLALAGAAGRLAEPIQVTPGAVCTVVADPEQEGLGHQDALRPTGDTPTRTPYTYFLGTIDNAVVVSGETTGDDPTVMSPDPVDSSDGRVEVDAESVGDEWKNHSFTFVVPEDAESYSVNIVHVYDIDTRDVVVTKTVAGEAFEDRDFSFQYSLDGGESWTPEPGTTISHEGTFTIEDVSVLDEHLEDTSVLIREVLGTDEAGPVVSWALDGDELTTGDYGDGYATASFVTGPVSTPTTPDQALNVTNSYAAIEVDKHIDGPLDGIGKTTLLPSGEDRMTIRYTVENIGAVELDTITVYDESLVNSLFTLPAGITVDPSSGEVSGCTLEFGPDNEDATCSFEVSFTDSEAPFHYEADTAEVTAEATTTIDGREIKATAADKHGAMRLSDLVAMLPATGVTTLVSVLAMGLIAALGALALYVRSRRK